MTLHVHTIKELKAGSSVANLQDHICNGQQLMVYHYKSLFFYGRLDGIPSKELNDLFSASAKTSLKLHSYVNFFVSENVESVTFSLPDTHVKTLLFSAIKNVEHLHSYVNFSFVENSVGVTFSLPSTHVKTLMWGKYK